MQILVADDDPIYRGLLEQMLREWRLDVVVARDGLEAMSIMQRPGAPKLMLLDWDMPGMDGFEVARAVRAEQDTANTYILLITGTRNKDDIMRVLVSGADDFLIKPFEPMDVKVHVRTALRVIQLQEEVDRLRLAGAGQVPGRT